MRVLHILPSPTVCMEDSMFSKFLETIKRCLCRARGVAQWWITGWVYSISSTGGRNPKNALQFCTCKEPQEVKYFWGCRNNCRSSFQGIDQVWGGELCSQCTLNGMHLNALGEQWVCLQGAVAVPGPWPSLVISTSTVFLLVNSGGVVGAQK